MSSANRIIFASLVALTMSVLIGLMVWALSRGGIQIVEMVLLTCFVIMLPSTVVGFWNAVIGFLLMRFSKNPAASVFPALENIKGNEKIESSTAIAMCIRNEDVEQVNRNLNAMIAQLVAMGQGKNFHVYVLSDSSFDDVIAEEEATFPKLAGEWFGKMAITYRRRSDNWGFKAGNISEFCDEWGANHDFMLTLDADSIMSAKSVLHMVRVMQKEEKLGILQSLVVGLPSDSAFTRVFQFGMRLAMRSFTLGSAWWQADCGPYWGHNALIRLKPFTEHCHLPVLPGKGPLSGYVLSHDQVEATYMRRAGYEVRVLAEEGGSYEENPPHILEFIRRDLRWCHGNMQYFKVIGEKGLFFTSRIQLALAILMFTGAPAWLTFVSVGMLSMVFDILTFDGFEPLPGMILFATIMTMIFMPKIASALDVLLNSKLRKAFGGGPVVMVSFIVEIAFSMILAPIMSFAETVFLAGLPFGRAKAWVSQKRAAHSLKLGVLAKHLWPQTLFGLGGLAFAFTYQAGSLAGILMALPMFIGPSFSLLFGYTSAHVVFGRFFSRLGLWQIPEEQTPPLIVRALNLPALALRAEVVKSNDRSPISTAELMAMDNDMDDRLAA